MPYKYEYTSEKLKKIFIREYNRINPKSAKEYNFNRTNGTPGWATLARLLGVKKWSELLKLCNLKPLREKTVTKVHSIIDLEQKLKKLEK